MMYNQLKPITFWIMDNTLAVWEETDVAFAVRKGVQNTNMRHLPKLLFSSIVFVS